MKRSEEVLIQTELYRFNKDELIQQIIWVQEDFNGRKIQPGVQVKLEGEGFWWTVNRTFTTMPRNVLEQNRGWRVGGIEDYLV